MRQELNTPAFLPGFFISRVVPAPPNESRTGVGGCQGPDTLTQPPNTSTDQLATLPPTKYPAHLQWPLHQASLPRNGAVDQMSEERHGGRV